MELQVSKTSVEHFGHVIVGYSAFPKVNTSQGAVGQSGRQSITTNKAKNHKTDTAGEDVNLCDKLFFDMHGCVTILLMQEF